jgi:6-pyruvoyltetrahydropterin/6-carboxytetrahydropterin synthase
VFYVTRRLHFSAGGRLHSEQLSDEENRAVYGKCNNPNGHGHNYWVEVTVRGPKDPRTGMVLDLKELDRVVRERVLDDVDHAFLNLDVPWLEGVVPTTENLAEAFWARLAPHVPGPAVLHEIRVHETEKNFVLYRGGA